MRARVLIVIAAFTFMSCAEAQTMRNPQGATPPSGTTRDPSSPARNTSSADRDAPKAGVGAPTRPPLGSEPSTSLGNVGRLSGVATGIGPNGGSGTGVGGGSPSVTHPNGANGGASPAPLGAARPNGGSPTNGSKASPMQANGVRKVQ